MSAHWKQRPEGGGWFAIWLIRTIARRGGRVVARACLYPIVLYFLVMRGPERRASRAYLARVLGRRAGLPDIARHIHTFAATILDRVFLLGESVRRFDVRTTGLDALHAQVDQGGMLLFGSHLGSFEVMRVLARQRPDIQVRVVLDKQHNPAMTQLLDALNPEVAATVIDAGQDGPSIVLAIQQAIAEGAIVAPRQHRAAVLGEMATRYAARLEHHARSAPYNWFNFYDYWQTGAPSNDPTQVRTQDRVPAGAGDDVHGVGRAA